MAPDPPPQHGPSASDNGNSKIAVLFAGLLAGVVLTGFAVTFLAESLSWDWKTLTGSDSPNLIEAWRNLGLIALGAVGVGLATWRSILAHQQNQNAIAQRRISERGMNVERYQKGAQMLESEELSVRIAGIYGLRDLAISDPQESYIIVQSLLFAFIRENSKARAIKSGALHKKTQNAIDKGVVYEELGSDVYEALDATTSLRAAIPNARQLEAKAQWRPNLTHANLSGANLARIDASGANLLNAKLFDANLDFAILSDASLIAANLSNTSLIGANLHSARLIGANLSGAFIVDAILTRANLQQARLSGANLSDANLTGANLRNAVLSGTNLESIKIGEGTNLESIWAWKENPPIHMPAKIAAVITYYDPPDR